METYDFIKACDLVHDRLAHGLKNIRRPAGKPVAILITPWLQTAVPFVSLEIALFLVRSGRNVIIFLDCTNLDINASPWFDAECAALRRLLQRLEPFVPFIDVTQILPAGKGLPPEWIAFNFSENAVRKEKGESAGKNYAAAHQDLISLAGAHSKKIIAALLKIQPEWVLIPGGFFGLTGLYSESCKQEGIPFTTFDSGPGDLRICHNGLAAQSEHIPHLFAQVQNNVPLSDQLWDKTRATISWRKEGNDPFQLQPKNSSAFTDRGHLVICLNFRADTAAMMRQLSFASVQEWVRTTAAWALAHQTRLYVRQHPCERMERYRSSDDFGALLKEMDPEETFLRFISCHDDINTYDLIQEAVAVLPYTSRVGIEAAVLGKVVILNSLSFYKGLGFTFDADQADTYLAFLEKAIAGKLMVSPAMQRAASTCYSLLSDYSRIPTHFTPVPADFLIWSATAHETLWQQDEMRSLAESLFSRKPFAFCHYPELRENPAPLVKISS